MKNSSSGGNQINIIESFIPSNINVTENEFKKFSILVYEKTGINLHIGKKQLLESRLSKILRKREIQSFTEYYNIIVNDTSGKELMHFINLISTNTTHFFREQAHFDFMKETFPTHFAKQNQLEGWCAASSTGEEPYTILITLNEIFGNNKKFSLLATDIDTEVLAKAERGIYKLQSLEKLPESMKKKYFQIGTKSAEGYVKVRDEIRNKVQYKKINLVEPLMIKKQYDFIFCRNVMIYFDKNVKTKVVNLLYDCLKPGSYFFVGHSESLNGLQHKFSYVKPAIYFKD